MEKSIKNVTPGSQKVEGLTEKFDYSHLLSSQQRDAGYSLGIEARHYRKTTPQHVKNFFQSHVYHGGVPVGTVEAEILPRRKSVEVHSSLDAAHRGKGLGQAMYEAAYAHAHSLGAQSVSGLEHSDAASRVHQALARKHGFDYVKRPLEEPYKTWARNKEEVTIANHPYHYLLKSEEVSDDDLVGPGRGLVFGGLPESGAGDCAAVLVSDGTGKILFGKRRDNGKWTPPAGHLNPGELPIDGARRELYEESGLKPEHLTFLAKRSLPNGGYIFFFTALCPGTPHSRNDPDNEVEEWKWVDTKEGLPKSVHGRLAGPQDDTNLIRQVFDLQKKLPAYNPLNRPEKENQLWNWVDTGNERENVPEMPQGSPERVRALHKLSAATKVRRAADGKREFLLHRGMGFAEARKTGKNEGLVQHQELSSWTPDLRFAKRFAREYRGKAKTGPFVRSAWIHEDAIHNIPKQYGNLMHRLRDYNHDTHTFGDFQDPYTPGPGGHRDEHEVLVKPHTSVVASPGDVEPVEDPYTDINQRISARGGHKLSSPKTLLSQLRNYVKPGLQKSIAQIAPGRKLQEGLYDYSHVLSPQHRNEGYKLWVSTEHPGGQGNFNYGDTPFANTTQPLEALVVHGKKQVGQVKGHVDNGVLNIGKSLVLDAHRGRGLGTAAYEAVMAHAKHAHGALGVAGNVHTPEASMVHRKLATKHGMQYRPVSGPGGRLGEYNYILKSESLLKMAVMDLPVGRPIDNAGSQVSDDWSRALNPEQRARLTDNAGPQVQVFDYSHALSPEQRAAGYHLHVTGAPGEGVDATLKHNGENVGGVSLVHLFNEPGYLEPHSNIEEEHRRKGLGTAMYEAAYRHAREAGYTGISGRTHSQAAHSVHQKLAAKHGLDYSAPAEGVGEIRGRQTRLFGPYNYVLKSEASFKAPLGQRCPHGLEVFLVNGEHVRDHYDSDFVQGGNPERYSWIPKGEIWIDQNTPEAEIPFVLGHECREAESMKGGDPYDKAHDKAKAVEDRERHEDPEEMAKALPTAELGHATADEDEPELPPAKPKKARTPKASPVEDPRDMVVMHNLTAGNLHHASALGGLPAPSLAIAHKNHPLTGFGEISLIGHHSMVDPSRTPVFDADVYSPRYPTVHYRPVTKELNKLQNWIVPYYKKIGEANSSGQVHQLGEDLRHHGHKEALTRDVVNRIASGLAFLEEKGHDLGPVPTRKKPMRYEWAGHPAIKDFLAKHGDQSSSFQLGDEYHNALGAAVDSAIKQHAAEQAAGDPGLENKLYNEQKDRVFTDGKLDFGAAPRILSDAKKAGDTEIDPYKMRERIEDALRQHGKEFQKWAEAKAKPAEGPAMIVKDSGRKVPHNLDNVMKELTRKVRDSEGFNYGLGNVRSNAAKKFSSISGIQKDRHRLVSHEEMEKLKRQNDDKFLDIAARLAQHHPAFKNPNDRSGFSQMDSLTRAMGESVKRGHSLRSELAKDGYQNVPPELVNELGGFIQDLRNMPTEYFEAKPQRVVNIGEFKGAAVPHDVEPEILELLKQHGIHNIHKYQRGGQDETEQRAAAVRRAAEADDLYLSEGDLEGEPLAKTEVEALLSHHHPVERALALKLSSVTPKDLAVAIRDPHPRVWQAAFGHPDAGHALEVLASHTRDVTGAPLFDRHDALLSDPRCTSHHLDLMERGLRSDAHLPIDVQAARIAILSGHRPVLAKSEAARQKIKEETTDVPAFSEAEVVPPHAAHLAEAYLKHVVPKGEAENEDLALEGASPKATYRVPVPGIEGPQRFMVKPYAEHQAPFSGWAEGTSQHLYHAAGLGHLHQTSFVAPHGEGNTQVPSTVIHIEKATPLAKIPVRLGEKRPGTTSEGAVEDARKIGLMDFVTGNRDRHGYNLMMRPNGELLAIDHGRAFFYDPVSDCKGWNSLGSFLSDRKAIGSVSGSPTTKTYEPTFQWWKQVSPAIKKAFEERLALIKSPRARERLRKNFDVRARHLDAIASGPELPEGWQDIYTNWEEPERLLSPEPMDL